MGAVARTLGGAVVVCGCGFTVGKRIVVLLVCQLIIFFIGKPVSVSVCDVGPR